MPKRELLYRKLLAGGASVDAALATVAVSEVGKADYSSEYIVAILEKAKQYLPGWLWKQLHQLAFPVAGGRARWRAPEEPSYLEKLALTEMRPAKLAKVPDEELRMAWLRLHQWYANVKRRKEAVENIVNAAAWVMAEMDKRGLHYNDDDDLAREARKVASADDVIKSITDLPEDIVVVPNFVCIVGSAAERGLDKANDLDVLFRAHMQEVAGEDHLLIQRHDVWLPLRKVLDPAKEGKLHFICNPQGPHATYVPLYDLVLRRTDMKRVVVKMQPTESDVHVVGPLQVAPEAVPNGGNSYVCPQCGKAVTPTESGKCPDCGALVVPLVRKQEEGEGHWVTIEGRPVFIRDIKATLVEIRLAKLPREEAEQMMSEMQQLSWELVADQPAAAEAAEMFMGVLDHYVNRQRGMQVQFAYDKQGNLLGGVAYRPTRDYMYVEYLAAHPKVVLGEVPAKGVGTQLLMHVAQQAAARGLGVKLTATPLSQGFYERLGMKLKEETATWTKDQAKQVAKLIPKLRSAFAAMKAAEEDEFDEQWFQQALRAESRYVATAGRAKGRVAKAELHAVTVGTGAMESPSRKDACLLVTDGGVALIFSAGPSILVEDIERYAENVDAVFVTDPDDAYEMRGARQLAEDLEAPLITPERDGQRWAYGDFRVTAKQVVHTNHPAYGFLIEHGGRKLAWAPEFYQPPDWIKGCDAAFLEAAAWDRPITFAGGVGGHAAALDTLRWLKGKDVGQAVFVHVGRPTERAIEQGNVPTDMHVSEDGEEFVFKSVSVGAKESVLKSVSPTSRFQPEKPMMAGTVEFFSTDELWPWVEKKLKAGAKLGGEIKFDGFRCILSKQGDKVSVWFEDAKEDRSKQLPKLVQAAKRSKYSSFVLDGELLATKGGKVVPRTQLMSLLTGDEDLEPEYHVFDCLYFEGTDLSGKPLEERRKYLEKVVPTLGDVAVISEQRPITDKASLERVGRWAASHPLSEGLVAKDVTKPYVFGGSDDWAKWKTVFELKATVLDVERKANGWTYHCGLLLGDAPFTNTTEFRGEQYVDLGKTFVTPERIADLGDTINVRVEEVLILKGKDGPRLAWGKPTVVGPDKSRRGYTAQQAVDLARRAHVLKEEVGKGEYYVQYRSSAVEAPTSGTIGAAIMFVGAAPGRQEAEQGQPFVGPSGQALEEFYLKPLGLARDQVVITNAVPQLLVDADGTVREPTREEICDWRPWLLGEVAKYKPAIIVALGNVAEQALDGLADFVLPHPAAVRRFDGQLEMELNAKLEQIKQALQQVSKADDEEGETRGQAAMKFWQQHWWELLPPTGRGKFVYQHHWRGLTEDEAKHADESNLLQTDHSVHGDLRFTGGEDQLWGFTVFIGRATDNRDSDRLISLTDDKLQGAFKLPQPKGWLKVGVGRPTLSGPGEVGATSSKWAKFFAQDTGAYEIGMAREHAIEVFFHGDKLKGRYLLQYAPVGGGRRVWLISKPEDQRPYAETHNLDDVIAELKQKHQRYLFWRDGDKFQRIDLAEKSYAMRLLKADQEKQYVLGVVLEPDTVDTQGDIISAEEIEQAAHWFMVESRVIGKDHRERADAEVVDSFVTPVDFAINGEQIKQGSWLLGIRIKDPELWKAVKEGKYTDFSVGGVAVRRPTNA
jgi:uracil-DNA glycosylase family 4